MHMYTVHVCTYKCTCMYVHVYNNYADLECLDDMLMLSVIYRDIPYKNMLQSLLAVQSTSLT